MAVPLSFKPNPVDPKLELERRLEAAPREHAEALLVAYDLLETAHQQGILDAAHGLVSAKDTVFAKLSEYAKTPEGIAALRNLIAAAKVLTVLDPALLDQLSGVVSQATAEHKQEKTPPSLLQLLRRSTSEDSRRSLSFLTLLLSHLGRSLK